MSFPLTLSLHSIEFFSGGCNLCIDTSQFSFLVSNLFLFLHNEMILLSHLIANGVDLNDDLLVLPADLFALSGESSALLTCCTHLRCHVLQLVH